MNPKENSELSAQTLLALRQESDALRVIAERLRVKEMGPADHIRTKHEIKTFIEVGSQDSAELLILRGEERRQLGQKLNVKMSQRREQHP